MGRLHLSIHDDLRPITYIDNAVIQSSLQSVDLPWPKRIREAHKRGFRGFGGKRSLVARQLAFVGDAWLNGEISYLIHHWLPDEGPEVYTDVRKILTSNDLWKHMSVYTNMIAALDPPLEAQEGYPKVVADAFEAHFGALKEENREEEMKSWVKAVFDHLLDHLVRNIKIQEFDRGAMHKERAADNAIRLLQLNAARDGITHKRQREDDSLDPSPSASPPAQRVKVS